MSTTPTIALEGLEAAWRATAESARDEPKATRGQYSLGYADGLADGFDVAADELAAALAASPDLRKWVRHDRDCPARYCSNGCYLQAADHRSMGHEFIPGECAPSCGLDAARRGET